jgi:hypothetical protein
MRCRIVRILDTYYVLSNVIVATRVQVILQEHERDAFQRQAAREGLSLSGWLRAAGRERLERHHAQARIRSVEELRAFFNACDAREVGEEPDWEEHLAVIDRSRAEGRSGT